MTARGLYVKGGQVKKDLSTLTHGVFGEIPWKTKVMKESKRAMMGMKSNILTLGSCGESEK